MTARAIRLLPLVVFSLALLPAGAQASKGDLYLGDSSAHKVIRVDPDSPKQHVVISGLGDPDGGAFTKHGKLLIADYSFMGNGAIWGINIGNGHGAPFASTTGFAGPTDVAVAPNGAIYVADPFAGTGGQGAIFRVTPLDPPELVSDGQHFAGGPLGISVTKSGAILTSDQDAGPGGVTGALIRVNPVTGHQTIVSQGHHLGNPYGMTLSPNGRFAYLADQTGLRIVRIKLENGKQKVILAGHKLDGMTDVAFGTDGMLYTASDPGDKPGVLSVDPKTGKTRFVTRGHKLDFVEGITVDPK